ncbi:uncharacterized protein LOC109846101 [Asparagus officinalis]|uniref:uncharacterized protein LOC109846101 n=1 Tax=Asparagus officinalis TaxID=4686 RepID=UPI00098E1188|nr:uncharacterized protein LOC109846101 [Asparagus officinalis]
MDVDDNNEEVDDVADDAQDNMDELLHDLFRDVAEESPVNQEDGLSDDEERLTKEAKKFYKLVDEGKQQLFPGCKTFSKLSFIIRLYLHKCIHGLSNEAFDDYLAIWREAIPEINLPKSYYEAKKIVKDLGLDYKKIHACPNDCMLYRGEDGEKVACSKCGESRWKANKQDVPAKVLRYFPLKPRVQRLFMCSQTAESMSWHAKERLQDGNLRHPADGKAWKDFDSNHPDFALDPRNVRLGLASDGFNPFRTMSISHSTWPVILINYNLPPWMSLKPEYFMFSLLIPGPQSPGNNIDVFLQPLIEWPVILINYNLPPWMSLKPEYFMFSLLIPGPQSPGNNIDVFLQPLIDDLKELWEVGLLTYDASSKQPFYVRAALHWTISDFPAFAMLSGWSTKGKLACPCCNYGTCSQYLKYSRKMCYMGHRRFLSDNHPWRLNRRNFNGHVELGKKPESLSGIEIMEELRGFVNDFGKKQKKKLEKGCPWKKRSIFFDLPYWEQNTCRHLLDLMHIEKNVCDNIIGTLLDIPEKTKDHVRARFDLQHMGIRRDLHPTKSADGRHFTFKSL